MCLLPINAAANFLYSITAFDLSNSNAAGFVNETECKMFISSGRTANTGVSADFSMSSNVNSNFLFLILFRIIPVIGVFFCFANRTALRVVLKVG